MDRPGHINEEVLLARLRLGDERAFGKLYHDFYPSLCFFANRIVMDKAISEDIVQEVLLNAWNRHEHFETLPSFKSFLYVSTRNACYDQCRLSKARIKHLQQIADEYVPDEQTTLEHIIETEVFRELAQSIQSLPEQCRNVIEMCFEGQKPKDIAAKLGITVSTVNSQKMRGISLLKERLSGQGIVTLLLLITATK